MIAVDTSAIVALALDEPDAERFAVSLEGSACLVGWPTLLEVHMVLTGYRKPRAVAVAEIWRTGPRVRVVEFDEQLFQVARHAFDHYGKGVGVKLNFGDCMAYAVAKVHDVPLLYKGGDFALTDIRAALP